MNAKDAHWVKAFSDPVFQLGSHRVSSLKSLIFGYGMIFVAKI